MPHEGPNWLVKLLNWPAILAFGENWEHGGCGEAILYCPVMVIGWGVVIGALAVCYQILNTF